MEYEPARAIKLPFWQDPQCFVITEHIRDEATVFCRTWDEPGQRSSQVGVLRFDGVWTLELERHTGFKSYPGKYETGEPSYYLVVDDSALLTYLEAERTDRDPTWRDHDKRSYTHYVVNSHDHWVDIVASGLHVSSVDGADIPRALARWDEV